MDLVKHKWETGASSRRQRTRTQSVCVHVCNLAIVSALLLSLTSALVDLGKRTTSARKTTLFGVNDKPCSVVQGVNEFGFFGVDLGISVVSASLATEKLDRMEAGAEICRVSMPCSPLR